MVTAGIISVERIISVVIGSHFGGGNHFDGWDHFGGVTGLHDFIRHFIWGKLMKFGFYHNFIVLIKLYLDAGDNFSIILCNFDNLLLRGFKVIEMGLRSTPPSPPRSQEAEKKKRAMNRGLKEFAFLFLSHKMIVSVTMFLNPSQLIDINIIVMCYLN